MQSYGSWALQSVCSLMLLYIIALMDSFKKMLQTDFKFQSRHE